LKNILLRYDVYILSDIEKYSREDILRFRNLGEATMKELEEICLHEGVRITSINEIAERMMGVRFTYLQLIKMFHMHIRCPEDFCKLTEEQYEQLVRNDCSLVKKIKTLKKLQK